ncbi:MucR family transcriptional regulator [Desulfonatronovibrio magnus]|uniref:MucR family transcriptional regulator n=1 Tax=Desulfonatronovibrio magnus TaxID=698827 RepID=UPI0005EB6F88|nr:MucR family transcriptional regulator [Desulfonatronovibrio magnus]RQD60645.1 MAG: transcriptional regulator [Desulfonatronovibrio sp. MSAO_Bac4]
MEDHLKQALEIVKAQASVRNMTEEEINSMILTVTKGIQSAMSDSEEEDVRNEPAVDPKKSIKERTIICLECGKQFKVITKKHLAKHDLTPDEYKEKWGFKKNASLVCKSLARDRRKKMNEMELWKKRNINFK